MFLIAGVSPKVKILDKKPHRCPVCGEGRAFYKRIDHYFSLFFIPIFPVKKGEPFIMCENCEKNIREFGDEIIPQNQIEKKTCMNCGRMVQQNFKYCPYCGKSL